MPEQSLFTVLTLPIFLLFVFWNVSDPRSFRERVVDFTRWETLGRKVFQGALFLLQAYYSLYVRPKAIISFDALTLIGLIFLGLGLLWAFWAKIEMGRMWGLPATFETKRQNRLITTGPFLYSRNPIYLGLLLGGVGYFLALRSTLLVLMLPALIYLLYSIKREEALLEKAFGNKYKLYRQKTPRFLLFL